MVANILATALPVAASQTSASVTTSCRPAFTTLPVAMISSHATGRSRLILNSTDSTSCPSGITVRAV